MLNLINFKLITFLLFIIIFFNTMVFGEESQRASIGEGMGSIFSGETVDNKNLALSGDSEIDSLNSNATIPVTNASQLVGLYVLYDFTVNFDSGAKFTCSDVQCFGDMAMTINNNMWQRLGGSGMQTVVASGGFSISGNTLTIYNDLVATNSIGTYAWDGTYLTTFLRNDVVSDPFTEIDVWKRVLSKPSDNDSDGIIDDWDTCPSTSSPCVNKTGCRCNPSNPAIPMLLLNED
jgi:hypothetical protein